MKKVTLAGTRVLCFLGASALAQQAQAQLDIYSTPLILQTGRSIGALYRCQEKDFGQCSPLTSYLSSGNYPAPGIGIGDLDGDHKLKLVTLARDDTGWLITWETNLQGQLTGTTRLQNLTTDMVGFGVRDVTDDGLPEFLVARAISGNLEVVVFNRQGDYVKTIDLPDQPLFRGFSVLNGWTIDHERDAFAVLHVNQVGEPPLTGLRYDTTGTLVDEQQIDHIVPSPIAVNYTWGGFAAINWYIASGLNAERTAALYRFNPALSGIMGMNLDNVPTDGLKAVLRLNSCDSSRSQDLQFSGNYCDNVDNDCDGLVDEDFGTAPDRWDNDDDGEPPFVPCDACPAPASCVGGVVSPTACANACIAAPGVPYVQGSGWSFVVNAYDFDVAADKLCFVVALASFGPVRSVACTKSAGTAGNFPADFMEFPQGASEMNDVSLDPNGRVWAANGASVFAQTTDLTMVKVADKPAAAAGCTTIDQIELVGPAARQYQGASSARPFVRCGSSAFELDPNTGTYTKFSAPVFTFGASPSNNFDMFFSTPSMGTRALARLNGGQSLQGLALLGAGAGTAQVGGVYIVGNGYAGGPPVIPSNDPGAISQWNGSIIEPVADLLSPFEVPNLAEGKYPTLSATTTNDGDSATKFPHMKVVEGGGPGIGGPSPKGLTDVVWELNNTARLYAYYLPAVGQNVKDSLGFSGDAMPITALSLRPPGQDIAPVAVCREVTVPAGADCKANVDASLLDGGSYDDNGDPIAFSLDPTGPFDLGESDVTLWVSDGYGFSECSSTITVVDQTGPTISAPADVSTSTCVATALVNLGQPTVNDNCVEPLVTGKVIKKNGALLNPPISVVNGAVTLGVGSYEVDWTASDDINTSHATQRVTVGTKLQAAQSFILDDRARVEFGGSFAQLFNSGSEITRIGNDARSGGIVSVANVAVQHRAVVSGSLLTAGTATVDSDATVTGAITTRASVVLPALPSLPTFPTPGSDRTLNSGVTTLAPGSYRNVIVNSGAEVRLGAGDYYFTSLALNSSSSIIRATASTRIFVSSALTLRSPIKNSSGAVQAVYVGFGGTTLLLEATFSGILLAPNAFVTLGTGSTFVYTGGLLAKSIEVRPDARLVCQ